MTLEISLWMRWNASRNCAAFASKFVELDIKVTRNSNEPTDFDSDSDVPIPADESPGNIALHGSDDSAESTPFRSPLRPQRQNLHEPLSNRAGLLKAALR